MGLCISFMGLHFEGSIDCWICIFYIIISKKNIQQLFLCLQLPEGLVGFKIMISILLRKYGHVIVLGDFLPHRATTTESDPPP